MPPPSAPRGFATRARLGYSVPMRLARLVWCAICTSCLILGVGCSDDDSAPPPASTGGGKGEHVTTGGNVGHHDAGPEEDDEDAGALSRDGGIFGGGGVVAGECYNVDPAPYMSDTTLGNFNNAIAKPSDFVITRVLATWDMSCVHPTILIALSDGKCPNGKGHELRFYIDAQSIVDGTVISGVNEISPETNNPDTPDPIRVRYFRPEPLEPAGNWGSCSLASGMLSIRGEIDANNLGNVEGAFDMELTACDGMSAEAQTLIGTFNAKMRRNLLDACPM